MPEIYLDFPPIPIKNELKIDAVYSFYYQEHGKHFNFEGDIHNFWEMVYVDSGKVSVKTEFGEHILNQGNVIFHKPMESHLLQSTDNQPHNLLIITFSSHSPRIHFFENKHFSVTLNQKRLLSHFADEAVNCFGTSFDYTLANRINHGKFGSMQACIAYFELFLIDLFRKNSPKANSAETDGTSQKISVNFSDSVKLYLAEMVEYHLTLAAVCERFNVSKSHLCQTFKNETGRSVMDYYIDLKIARAKLLIREGNFNLTQISEKLGYSGIHHFSRIFKSRVNMSPGSYAKSIK